MEDSKEDSKEWRLYLACRHGEKPKVIKLLKDEGADPTSADATNISTGGAPLHWACYHGWLDIVKDFVENYEMSPELATGYRETPLHCACQGGHGDTVQYLAKEKGCNVKIRNADECAPLHYSCQYEHLDIVRFFLNELKANAEVHDEDKRTPLHYATQGGHLAHSPASRSPQREQGSCSPWLGCHRVHRMTTSSTSSKTTASSRPSKSNKP